MRPRVGWIPAVITSDNESARAAFALTRCLCEVPHFPAAPLINFSPFPSTTIPHTCGVRRVRCRWTFFFVVVPPARPDSAASSHRLETRRAPDARTYPLDRAARKHRLQ